MKNQVSQQLRRAIKKSGQTHYRIGKQTGVDTRIIDRFVAGERVGLRLETVDKLCSYLGLELREASK